MLISSLLPIFCLILIGFFLSRLPLSSVEGWSLVERLTYYLFFPSLLILRLAESRFDWNEIYDISRVIGLALLGVTLLIIASRKSIAGDMASLSSIYQGSIRFNTYIGLAAIDAVFADRGLTAAALCLAVYVPLVNVLSVVSMSLQGEGGAKKVYLMVGSVVSNPLVLACMIGILMSYWGAKLPMLAEQLLGFLSQPALPLGLLAVGAGIRISNFAAQTWQIVIASILKLIILPALILTGCLLFEVHTLLASVLLILTALPAPPSAYILARQLGGNESLMANIITVETLLAFLMIPLWIEVASRYL